MIIVDRELERREREGEPIRLGMVGAGFMGAAIARQVVRETPGVRLTAISNRDGGRAVEAFREAGVEEVSRVETPEELDRAAGDRGAAVSDRPEAVCRAESVDAVLEVTGSVEFGARVALASIEAGKDHVMMNAELDGTLGPVLKCRAEEAGVVLTNADGDQPGVIMNLFRFVEGIGVEPVLCGNIKGFEESSRNPTTQQKFADRWGQNPRMVTAFTDGTKISFEQAVVANATGFRVAERGMWGPEVEEGTRLREAVEAYPEEQILASDGLVDYVVGAEPAPGVFVLGTHDDPEQRRMLDYYKMGEGPLYCFYRPYHLCHFEVPNTVARAVAFDDPAVTPREGPRVEVVATAKVDLEPGQELDGVGGYLTYGQAENAGVVRRDDLLPMGVSPGCRVTGRVEAGRVLTYDDVEVPPDRLTDRLRREQNELFAPDGSPRPGKGAVGSSRSRGRPS